VAPGLDDLMVAPRYKVQVWDMSGSGFGPGALAAEFNDAVNLGWADYLNDVPEAFFTLSQDDPKVSVLRDVRDNAHIKIYRDSDLVWGGFMGEWEANERDVIVYGYGYLALLYLYLTDWNTAYTNAQVDDIVDEQWTRAKTTLTSSLLEWVTTGTIEAPVTTTGGATPIVLPTYRVFYKRILHVMKEMAAISIGPTSNVVVFEITPSGTFNFWKDRGSDLDLVWRYGNRGVKGFSESNVPILRRNHTLAVGVNPNDVLLKQSKEFASDIAAKGRRMEPIFFSWVRDSDELERVMNRRAALAVRTDVDLPLEFYANEVVPPGATGAGWALADRVNVRVGRGVTNISTRQMVSGVQVLYVRGSEHVRALMQERPGT
jgi:hypothetical protein